jgi:rhamnogalacturonyl hydrolase YesR
MSLSVQRVTRKPKTYHYVEEKLRDANTGLALHLFVYFKIASAGRWLNRSKGRLLSWARKSLAFIGAYPNTRQKDAKA